MNSDELQILKKAQEDVFQVLLFLNQQESNLKDGIARGASEGRSFWIGDLDRLSPQCENLNRANSILIGLLNKQD